MLDMDRFAIRGDALGQATRRAVAGVVPLKKQWVVHLFALWLFSSCAEQMSIDYQELVQRDGLLFEKYSDEPFSGPVTGVTQGWIKNGVWDGKKTTYDSAGQLRFREHYKAGVLHGERSDYSFWSNGALGETQVFREGILHGPIIRYYADGSVRWRLEAADGRVTDDTFSASFGDGSAESTVALSAGKANGTATNYFLEAQGGGISKEVEFLDGVIHGKCVVYNVDQSEKFTVIFDQRAYVSTSGGILDPYRSSSSMPLDRIRECLAHGLPGLIAQESAYR